MTHIMKISFFFFIMSGITFALPWRVPEDFPDGIQSAIIDDRVNDGDTISVWIRTTAPPDSYYENIDFNGKSLFLVNRSYLPRQTSYDSSWDHIVINGCRGNNTVVMYFEEPPIQLYPAIIKGFTITGGAPWSFSSLFIRRWWDFGARVCVDNTKSCMQ